MKCYLLQGWNSQSDYLHDTCVSKGEKTRHELMRWLYIYLNVIELKMSFTLTHYRFSVLSHLVCTPGPSSPLCTPWSHSGHNWSGQRSHFGPCRTCCREVRSSWNHSGSEVGTPGWEAVRDDGTSATVHRGSAWRRGALAQSADLRGTGRPFLNSIWMLQVI